MLLGVGARLEVLGTQRRLRDRGRLPALEPPQLLHHRGLGALRVHPRRGGAPRRRGGLLPRALGLPRVALRLGSQQL